MLKNKNLIEGVEMGDLERLVQPVLTVDEFRSKMGEDKDIIVAGMTVMGQEPAEDIVNFIEKSYDWVLDGDISSGETSDGNYLVFVELERKPEACDHLLSMLEDLINLTGQKIEDWSFTYFKDPKQLPLTTENLESTLITTPEEYELKTGASLEESAQLNSLRALAGVKVQKTVIKDLQILDLQVAAGIR
jgi:hypothetical protein